MQVIRIPNKVVKERSDKLKKLINKGNYSAFNFLYKDSMAQTPVQAVPYCDVGCAHCYGSACSEQSPVVAPEELKDYIEAVIETEQGKVATSLCFSGLYGDPFCGFGEENSVDYYVDLLKTALSFPDIESCLFMTSGAHFDDEEKLKSFFIQAREIEKEKQKQFDNDEKENIDHCFITFSVDAFHAHKVPQRKIQNAVKVIKEAYNGADEELILYKLGFRGQTALSVSEPEGGKQYLLDFLKTLDGVFEKRTGLKDFHYTFNETTSGRAQILKHDHLGGFAFTKAKDGNLVMSFVNGKNICEYELKKDVNGKIDRKHLRDVRINMVMDSLTLKTAPLHARSRGRLSNILLKEFCDEGASLPENIDPHIKNNRRVAFETFSR